MTGEPSYFEIGVPDPDRAQAFYGSLFGWTFEETGFGARIATAGVPGGCHPDEPGMQIFFSVPDIDDAVRRVVELGGEVDEGSSESASGRFVYSCRDDQGVPFGLHQPTTS